MCGGSLFQVESIGWGGWRWVWLLSSLMSDKDCRCVVQEGWLVVGTQEESSLEQKL